MWYSHFSSIEHLAGCLLIYYKSGNKGDGCDQGGARLQGHLEGRSPHADTAAGQSLEDLDLKSLCIGLESYRFI